MPAPASSFKQLQASELKPPEETLAVFLSA